MAPVRDIAQNILARHDRSWSHGHGGSSLFVRLPWRFTHASTLASHSAGVWRAGLRYVARSATPRASLSPGEQFRVVRCRKRTSWAFVSIAQRTVI